MLIARSVASVRDALDLIVCLFVCLLACFERFTRLPKLTFYQECENRT